MKPLILLFLCLIEVYSLGLTVSTLVGNTAVVQWTREELDPVPLSFDLRFVIPPYYDVGIAKETTDTSSLGSSGNITVQFPEAGRYVLVAVSGQNNAQIGRTAIIEVPGNTTLPTLTQTPVPSQTLTPRSIPPSPSKSLATDCPCPKKKPNVVAIVFAVLGGVSLLTLLVSAVFYFYFRRRRPTEVTRISFHRERMVQQRPSDGSNVSVASVIGPGGTAIPYAFTGPRASLGSSSSETHRQDIEQGLAIPPPVMTSLPRNLPGTPLTSGYVVPPPRGPRDRATSVRRVGSSRVARVNSEPTARQQMLVDKLVEVEKQISELNAQPKPLPSTVVLLEDLNIQKAWLVKQQGSMWALEEVDTLPPGYSRYMT
jgi:hypothetical protein